jgi:four helix bundle protein
MPPYFDHEKLNVYQESIRFVAWSSDLLPTIPKKSSVCDQLDRASTPIPLILAEGNGKFVAPDRCKFLDSVHGSVVECAGCLDVLVAKRQIPSATAKAGRAILVPMVSMLVGLIKTTSTDRVCEEPGSYRVESRSKSRITSQS